MSDEGDDEEWANPVEETEEERQERERVINSFGETMRRWLFRNKRRPVVIKGGKP